jgi:hypothetical protein
VQIGGEDLDVSMAFLRADSPGVEGLEEFLGQEMSGGGLLGPHSPDDNDFMDQLLGGSSGGGGKDTHMMEG